ncbi:hypothetical protein BU16DRAFT_592473 [Lophium mytilinum]|uniref:Uncharacterized protein n=1 Tax=Lophium mytilinum TaxID=390894 RepID=A0A6A6QKS1_9PEZI|nr:hypothetical protein BU16DRAFT_592473 [Lophium mytilinum]
MTMCPLLALPREIRDMIWGLALQEAQLELPPLEGKAQDYDKALPITTTGKAFGDGLPALCRTSKQLFEESTPFFLSRIMVTCTSASEIEELLHFLEKIPNNEGFKAIHQLRLGGKDMFCRWQHRQGENKDFAALKRFPKLEDVLFDVRQCGHEELFLREGVWYCRYESDQPRLIEPTFEKLDLNGLFECTSLKAVIIVKTHHVGLVIHWDDFHDRMAPWIHKQFADKGLEVSVMKVA